MNPLTEKSETILKLPHPIIEGNVSDFREKFNRSPFVFSHNLSGHPLFEIPRLVELSNTILSKEGYKQPKCQGAVYDRNNYFWEDVPIKEKVSEAIAQIKEKNFWILLYSVQLDPDYKVLLDQITSELEEQIGMPLKQEITRSDIQIFMASPQAITPYHIDHDATFLFQIQGERKVNVFDPRDRKILSESEIEKYYAGLFGTAIYKKEYRDKATVYQLTAGKGVHHPALAPHCYENGNSYSISLGIHFCLRSYDLRARIYQVNYIIRKLGFNPTPPDQSVLKDNLKKFMIGLFTKRKSADKYELIRSGFVRIMRILSFAIRLVNYPKQMLIKVVKNRTNQ